jgi:hypothetical protein
MSRPGNTTRGTSGVCWVIGIARSSERSGERIGDSLAQADGARAAGGAYRQPSFIVPCSAVAFVI